MRPRNEKFSALSKVGSNAVESAAIAMEFVAGRTRAGRRPQVRVPGSGIPETGARAQDAGGRCRGNLDSLSCQEAKMTNRPA